MSTGPIGGATIKFKSGGDDAPYVDGSGTDNNVTGSTNDKSKSPPPGHSGDDTPILPAPNHEVATMARGSDLGGEIAALLIEVGYEQKKDAKAARDQAEKALEADNKRQTDAMQKAADYRLASGIVSGTSMIASGVFQVGASTCVGSDGKATPKADAWKGYSTGSEGAGKVGSAILDHAASMADIDAKKAEQDATRDGKTVDDERDAAKDARDLINRAVSYYKEYLQAKNDAMKAAIMHA